jgi:hypothetical protein
VIIVMGRCKVRVRRLTLAPGVLAGKVEGCAAKVRDEEAKLILAREHLQHDLDLSAAASSSRRVWPHVHGVGSRIEGRFWASGSSSESESEEYVLSAHRVTSLGLDSICTLDRPSVHLPDQKAVTSRAPAVGTRCPLSKEVSMPDPRVNSFWQPWQGSLPPPRKSPMLRIGDAPLRRPRFHRILVGLPDRSMHREGGW